MDTARQERTLAAEIQAATQVLNDVICNAHAFGLQVAVEVIDVSSMSDYYSQPSVLTRVYKQL